MDFFDKARERLASAMGGQKPTLERAEDQTDDEKKLVAYVRSKIDESRANGSRIALEGIWMTNTAYLKGFDSVFYDTNTRQYKPVGTNRASLRKGRLHVNKILPTIQNRLARLTKNPPRYEVRPESNEQDDKDAAVLGVQVINDSWDRQHINRKRLELLMWVQQCGYAFMKVSWDPTLGSPLINPETNEIDGYQGDKRWDVVSAFEVFQDPLAQNEDEVQWYTQAKVRKLEYFKEMYPGRGDLVKEEGAWLLSAQYEMRINSLNSQGPTSTGTDSQMKNAAIECALYEKPSRKYPRGRFVVTANGVLLHDGELQIGELPFIKFDDTMIAGSFAPESVITHLRPIQDQYNRTIQKRAQWTNRLLAGKWLAAKGHGISQESLNDESGEIIQYDPVVNASPPTPVPVPMIPQWAYEEEDRLDGAFNELSGIGDLSKGQLPAAGIPAIGMQFLQEQDETRLGVMTEQHELAYARMGTLDLKFTEKFYTTDRTMKIAGEGLKYTVKKFKGADLKGNHDVIVKRGSTLPSSTVLNRQNILNALTAGILGNPQDPEVAAKVLSAMEFGTVEDLWQDLSVDNQQVSEHLAMIKAGTPPPVDEMDNHQIFIQTLNRVRKSDEYRAMSPTAQLLLKECIEAHLAWVIKLQNPGLGTMTSMAEEMTKVNQEHGATDPVEGAPGAATAQLQNQNTDIASDLAAQSNPEGAF